MPFVEPAIDAGTEEDIHAAQTDAAVYVVSRNSGESETLTPAFPMRQADLVRADALLRL